MIGHEQTIVTAPGWRFPGVLDGLSAWLSPEARPMMLAIVVGSTVKGVVTGLLAGLVARWRHSVPLGVGAGVAIGFVLIYPRRQLARAATTRRLCCRECSSVRS